MGRDTYVFLAELDDFLVLAFRNGNIGDFVHGGGATVTGSDVDVVDLSALG